MSFITYTAQVNYGHAVAIPAETSSIPEPLYSVGMSLLTRPLPNPFLSLGPATDSTPVTTAPQLPFSTAFVGTSNADSPLGLGLLWMAPAAFTQDSNARVEGAGQGRSPERALLPLKDLPDVEDVMA